MIVSIQDDMNEILTELEKNGYEVHRLSENIASEAYIYSEEKIGLSNFYNMIPTTDRGTLLIDSDGKSINDLVFILNHRVYSPLF